MDLTHRSHALAHYRAKPLASNAHLALAFAGMVILCCGLAVGSAELVAQTAAGTKMPDGIVVLVVNLLSFHLG